MAPAIEVVRGDITRQQVDAIVNAANPSLLGGGGVDGAIHRAGGPQILEACRELRATVYPDGLPTGWAVQTTAGCLPASWVIHTVGPVHGSDPDPAGNLARCHASVLRVADHVGARSVAFPAISTGAFGYPLHEAAAIALLTVTTVPTHVETVRFVLLDEEAFAEFVRARKAAAERQPGPTGLPRPDPGAGYGVGAEWLATQAVDSVLSGLGEFLDGF